MANPVQGPAAAAAPVAAPAVNFNNRYEKLEITKAYLGAIASGQCTIESLAAKVTILAFPVIAAVTLIMDAINYMIDSSNKNAAIKEVRAQFAAANPEEAARRAGAKKEEEVDFDGILFDELPLPEAPAEAKPADPKAVFLVNAEGIAHVAEKPVDEFAAALAVPLPEGADDLEEQTPAVNLFGPAAQDAVPAAEVALPGKVILAGEDGAAHVAPAPEAIAQHKAELSAEEADRRETPAEDRGTVALLGGTITADPDKATPKKASKKAEKRAEKRAKAVEERAKAVEARATAAAKKAAEDELKAKLAQ